MSTLKRGGNKLIERQLYRADGTTPLLLSEIDSLQAQIIQYGRLLAAYNFKPGTADSEIRQGSSTSIIEIEITKELSVLFREGAVMCKLLIEDTDAEFITDGEFADPQEFELFTVEA